MDQNTTNKLEPCNHGVIFLWPSNNSQAGCNLLYINAIHQLIGWCFTDLPAPNKVIVWVEVLVQKYDQLQTLEFTNRYDHLYTYDDTRGEYTTGVNNGNYDNSSHKEQKNEEQREAFK